MEGNKYGDIKKVQFMETFTGYNVWRLKMKFHCMETHIEVAMHGDTYRVCHARRFILRVKCMVNHIEGEMYGSSYRG